MVYNVDERLNWVGTRLKEVKPKVGSYKRGATTVANVTFTHLDIDRNEVALHDALLLSDELRSFSFDSGDIFGTLGLPLMGDRVVIGTDEYEVLPVAGRAWQHTTLSKLRIRVYCRNVQPAA